MPYAPQDENSVIALFAILCNRGIVRWQILDLSGGSGIDALCHDEESKNEIRVEFKLVLSKNNWNHDFNKVDYVVCWKNTWPDFPKKVIDLKKVLTSNNSLKRDNV